MNKPDQIYSKSSHHLVDFAFDESVAEVFPDMIRRSVPGYDTVIAMLGVLAKSHFQVGTRIYDLGCSLGAATLSVHRCLGMADVSYVVVDNAPAMMAECRLLLERLMPKSLIDYREEDIRDATIRNASVVVLNFTLQFLPQADREAVLQNIHAGLVPGGILVLSEKIHAEEAIEEQSFLDLHHGFKVVNGYSELEISQKRIALENVLCPETISQHQKRLAKVGFSRMHTWFRCLSFISLLAMR